MLLQQPRQIKSSRQCWSHLNRSWYSDSLNGVKTRQVFFCPSPSLVSDSARPNSCAMGDVDVLKAQVVRRDANEPWGFRLQGGSDVGQPLTITRVRTVGLAYITTSFTKWVNAVAPCVLYAVVPNSLDLYICFIWQLRNSNRPNTLSEAKVYRPTHKHVTISNMS